MRSIGASLFARHAACIAKAGKDKAMSNIPELVLVAREPSERSDCAGDEEKSIGVAWPKHIDMTCQHRRNGDS